MAASSSRRRRRLILIRPITSSSPSRPRRAIRTFPAAPPLAAPTCRAATGSPPAAARSVPETERPRRRQRRAHADARARPSKKPDVSSDRIGAASRRPRVGVNRSEGASTCAPPRGPPAPATRVAVARGYKCPAPHPEQVSSPPPLFLPLAEEKKSRDAGCREQQQ
jgi:hypothetical protein